MQLSPESGNIRSLLPDSGEHVWPDPAILAISGRLLTMAKFRQNIRQDFAGIWSVGIWRQWPDVAGFRRRQSSGDRIPAPVLFR